MFNISSSASVSSKTSTKSKLDAKSSSDSVGGKKKLSTKPASVDIPLSLHAAIAQVKERFPIRRQYKDLVSWEDACSRFFREFMRHPWLGTARPKFVFHAPVTMLFPEVKEAYNSKIENPTDLTTVESKLLQGGVYQNSKDFIDEVALIFIHAITFNQTGRNEGNPMSCAYYDAAKHLLRYARWLSLEYLSSYLTDDSDALDSSLSGDRSWSLTTSARKRARQEMETIVLTEPMEKSDPGDKYTWMESECEKPLKALRHQSDLKYMTYFIQPQYPADYAAYVSKPMDWEKCRKNLEQRNYQTIGEVLENLRLIFSNALKYNARAKGTDTVSGRAYEAANHMSTKLESAIDKLLTSVSERLVRERIDKVTTEREVEAAEQAEEDRQRAAWQKEREKAREQATKTVEVKTRVETIETVKVVQRKSVHRREMMAFEYPFHEEDDGNHEQAHLEVVRQQKLAFEKQLRDRAEMHMKTLQVGLSLYNKLAEREKILSTISSHSAKNLLQQESKEKSVQPSEVKMKGDSNVNNDARVRICFKLMKRKK